MIPVLADQVRSIKTVTEDLPKEGILFGSIS